MNHHKIEKRPVKSWLIEMWYLKKEKHFWGLQQFAFKTPAVPEYDRWLDFC